MKEITKKRFWDKVNKTDSCWDWTGCILKSGYGQVTVNKQQIYAHRLSYMIHKGDIQDDRHIDHLCRNPSCVNPDHLEVVSQADNTRRGLSARLTTKDVEDIRGIYKIGDCTQKYLGGLFGVSRSQISLIVNMKRWVVI